MPDVLWLILAATLNVSGMGWLALAMDDVHWTQAMHRPAAGVLHTRRWLRGIGAVALVSSLLVCLVADRASMAVLVWVMLLAGSAVVVAMILAFRPRLMRLLWPSARQE